MFGTLTAVECGPVGVTIVVNLGSRVLRVTSPAFDRFDFITYRKDLKGGVKSDAVAVEFTPLGYKP